MSRPNVMRGVYDQYTTPTHLRTSPQANRGAQADTVTGNKLWCKRKIDSTASVFLWKVRYKDISKDHLPSPTFTVGRYPWKLLIFEREVPPHMYLSFYLVVADYHEVHSRPNSPPREVTFNLKCVHATDPSKSISKPCDHSFTHKDVDWGFNEFMKMDQMRTPGFITYEGDTPFVTLEVIVKDLTMDSSPSAPHDSKRETGYVGLKNQGATCYLSSLLQTLFHLSYFRKGVYQMAISDYKGRLTKNGSLSRSKSGDKNDMLPIPLALQRLFYWMQYSKEAVKTEELTQSFGWGQVDSFTQHDIQELNRVLCDNLENKMCKEQQSTPADNTIQYLFVGKYRSYIKCINIQHESSREDVFYDLQLCVSGCANLFEAFAKELEVEVLSGDNKYNAGPQYGLQDAKKGIEYLKFPPVLEIHLKRFEYDVEKATMKKVVDEFQFPEEIDLAIYMDRHPADDTVWMLHSVLVHCGGVSGGHYYAFIRPDETRSWFKFDDDKVTKATKDQAVNENFGGKDPDKFWLAARNIPCAYMLVYIQRTEWNRIMFPIADSDVPHTLKQACVEEEKAEELARMEKEEEKYNYTFRIATVEDFAEFDQQELHTDLLNFDRVKPRKYRKDDSWSNFQHKIQKDFGIHPSKQRLWKWTRRYNKTYRPDTPVVTTKVTSSSKLQYVLQMQTFTTRTDRLDLFLETCCPKVPEYEAWEFQPITDKHVFLLFKYYDPVDARLLFQGHKVVNSEEKASSVIPFLNSLIGKRPDHPLLLYEEVRPNMVDNIDLNKTLSQLELQSGDILVFQPPVPEKDRGNLVYPHAPDMFRYLYKRLVVKFAPKNKPNEVIGSLELTKDHTLAMVCQKLNEELLKHIPASHIRLSAPRDPQHTSTKQLKTFLTGGDKHRGDNCDDIIFYEELSIPLSEYENKRALSVHLFDSRVKEMVGSPCEVLLDKNSTVKHILSQLKPKFPAGTDVHLVEIDQSELRTIFVSSDSIERIPSTSYLRVEQIPSPTIPEARDNRKVEVVHFDSKTVTAHHGLSLHSQPFLMFVCQFDTIGQMKQKITQKLGTIRINEWKLCVLFGQSFHNLTDDNLSLLLSIKAIENQHYHYGNQQWRLGMDHPQRGTSKKQDLVIYN